MREFKSVLLIGGTSDIGLAIVKSLVKRGTKFVNLIARDSEGLQIATAQLMSESPELFVSSHVITHDLSTQIDNVIEDIEPELVLISVGKMINQNQLDESPGLIHGVNEGNVEIPTIALLATVRSFERLGKGNIAILGSVAGDRGRAINYVYGAGKAFLETICEGLWQRIQGTEIKLTLVKPGPTETKMSKHVHKSKVKLAAIEQVSEVIAEGILSEKSVVYAPKVWKYTMKIVQLLPKFFFNRLHF